MQLILAVRGKGPSPQLTDEEAHCVSEWLAGWVIGDWVDRGIDPDVAAADLLDHYQSAYN